jgi:enterochelin esterase-like enzyme
MLVLLRTLLIVLALTTLTHTQTRTALTGPPYSAADASASPRIATLLREISNKDGTAVDRFWSGVQASGAPLIEPIPHERGHSLITFVWRGSSDAHNVVIVDGVAVAVGGLNPVNSEMIHIGGTDVWYRTYKVRNDARFIYKLSENDSLQWFLDPNRKSKEVIDPLNPRVFPSNQSYVELPDAPSQKIALAASDMPGKVEKMRFHSTTLNDDRDVWVYTPHNFRTDGAPYPLAVVLDGLTYTTWVPVPTILDNLIAEGKIPPVVAVLVGSAKGRRDAEDSCLVAFGDFLANELVPWMQTNYRAKADPKSTVIGGPSRAGLASTCTAYQHPAVFGKVLSQSGSYWWKPDDDPKPEWLTRQIASSPAVPVQFYMEVGEMEIPLQLDTNRRLRDVLRSKRYVVDYREFNGNHTYLDWRGTFGDGLTSLLGPIVRERPAVQR